MRLKPFLLDGLVARTQRHRMQSCLHSGHLDCQRTPRPGRTVSPAYLNHQVDRPPAGADSWRSHPEMQVSVGTCRWSRAPRKPNLSCAFRRARCQRHRGRRSAWELLGVPESLGLELRYYRLLRENSFRIEWTRSSISRFEDKLILVKPA